MNFKTGEPLPKKLTDQINLIFLPKHYHNFRNTYKDEVKSHTVIHNLLKNNLEVTDSLIPTIKKILFVTFKMAQDQIRQREEIKNTLSSYISEFN